MSDELMASRRIVFAGLGAVGVAAALAGCGGGGGSATENGGPRTVSVGPAGTVLAATADIPVGGGVVDTKLHIVITQPTAGTFEAFSSKCKHQGFDVGEVEDSVITCNVHNSTYDARTGARTGGPAPAGSSLDKVEIKVQGDNIVAV